MKKKRWPLLYSYKFRRKLYLILKISEIRSTLIIKSQKLACLPL